MTLAHIIAFLSSMVSKQLQVVVKERPPPPQLKESQQLLKFLLVQPLPN